MKNLLHIALILVTLPLLFTFALAGWRVDYFQVFDGNDVLVFSAPAANGNKFTTRYIHSVERTPVEDEYRIVGGRIWMWEERVRSSNAGLPSMKPVRGRFIDTGEWFIYQGGRHSFSKYYYRVGNQFLGLNQADFDPFGRSNFYDIFKGERMLVLVTTRNMLFTKCHISEKFLETPCGAPPVTQH